MSESQLTIIGRAEKVAFPELGAKMVPTKIDTGADSSSIWAHVTKVEDERLKVVFFSPESPYYTGDEHVFEKGDFVITRVSNSFGQRELRYKVTLKIKVHNRVINGTFTLADRSKKLYPVLIGRSLLKKKFLVDVSLGSPLRKEEKERADRLHEELVNTKEVTT
ncbi:MAG: ribosomal protein modification protein RimK [Candidatus Saccharibacteria bacterium]|nr:ribosomal protein modification protein RimK [Candidatus Saccharibacteria bacterium]